MNNTIGFTEFEVKNAAGGFNSIEKQGSIGFAAFSKLQKEMTELAKAGGYEAGYLQFSKFRPEGSKLRDMDTRMIVLFGNIIQ